MLPGSENKPTHATVSSVKQSMQGFVNWLAPFSDGRNSEAWDPAKWNAALAKYRGHTGDHLRDRYGACLRWPAAIITHRSGAVLAMADMLY